jgi:uncharacterized protein (DUF1015 family)
MARIFPFQPYRYSPSAGALGDLVTQPYDKISPAMQARYLGLNPHNLVRVILGERRESDTERDNVYTRAAGYFDEWIRSGVLVKETEPALFPYYQEFAVPDTGDRILRKGFIALGAIEPYSAGVVHRHEQTLTGPKRDRLELLRHTHAHCGQIFVLYPDQAGRLDGLLDDTTRDEPLAEVTDEYAAVHRLWKVADARRIAELQDLMAEKKLIIADGHHRYETALAFANENAEWPPARLVMMTFVNMYSPGLRILATHRLVHSLADFQPENFLQAVEPYFRRRPVADARALLAAWSEPHPKSLRIGAAFHGMDGLWLLESEREEDDLDVKILHERILQMSLGLSEETVRDERHIRYTRGLDAALKQVRRGEAQAAFLLEPATIQQVAKVSFSGGVMPQKSTDFYPKLLSGVTIYRLE